MIPLNEEWDSSWQGSRLILQLYYHIRSNGIFYSSVIFNIKFTFWLWIELYNWSRVIVYSVSIVWFCQKSRLLWCHFKVCCFILWHQSDKWTVEFGMYLCTSYFVVQWITSFWLKYSGQIIDALLSFSSINRHRHMWK